MLVWYAAWQLECCGTPFAVGDEVTWTLHDEVDHDWLGSVVGEDVARQVDRLEEHHGGLPPDAPTTTGLVRRSARSRAGSRCPRVPTRAKWPRCRARRS